MIEWLKIVFWLFCSIHLGRGIMFENTIELQQNSGLRGMLNRHFGPIDTPEHALKAVRSIAMAFIWLGVVVAVFAFAATVIVGFTQGLTLFIDVIIWAGLGFWLLRRQSRIAAGLLLAFGVIPVIRWAFVFVSHHFNPFDGGNIFIQIAILAMAWRATYASFRYRGNWKGL
jgi:hypothetical protein